MKYTIKLFFLFFFLNCCKSTGGSYVKEKLNLKKSEYKLIKKDTIITNALNKSLKDSVNVNKINKRLDSFFLNSYTRKELIAILKIDRVFKGKLNIEFDKGKDTLERLNFDDVKEFKKFMLKVKKRLNGENVKIQTPNKEKDSL